MTMRHRVGMVMVLLVGGLCGQTLLGHQLGVSAESRPRHLVNRLATFPKQVGDWNGVDEAPRPEVLEMMKLDDYLQRVYRHPSGAQLVLWISHSATSRDAYHYPTVCMKGNGWEEEESARTEIAARVERADTKEESVVRQTRFRFRKENRERQFVYYWYYLIGESSLDQTMRRLSQSTRLFLRGRTNASVTVEIFTGDVTSDPKLLDAFARAVALELERYLPAGTRAECALGANL